MEGVGGGGKEKGDSISVFAAAGLGCDILPEVMNLNVQTLELYSQKLCCRQSETPFIVGNFC